MYTVHMYTVCQSVVQSPVSSLADCPRPASPCRGGECLFATSWKYLNFRLRQWVVQLQSSASSALWRRDVALSQIKYNNIHQDPFCPSWILVARLRTGGLKEMSYHWHWGDIRHWTGIFVLDQSTIWVQCQDRNNDPHIWTRRQHQTMRVWRLKFLQKLSDSSSKSSKMITVALTTNLSNFVKENSDISSKLQRFSRIWMTAKFNLPRLLSDSLCILLIKLKYLEGLIFCDKSVRAEIPIRYFKLTSHMSVCGCRECFESRMRAETDVCGLQSPFKLEENRK